MGEIRIFLYFYVKISQNWLNFLGFPQTFGASHLKNVKMLLKKLIFMKLFACFVVQNSLNAIFGRINRFLV